MWTAAVVTVGTELVTGLVVDTNAAEIGVALTAAGLRVAERVSLPDDADAIADALARLSREHALVVVTGGLGPTHDDITREAASQALGVPLVRDEGIAGTLTPWLSRHAEPDAIAQVLRQADVLDGALVLPATVGTAPGLVAETPAGRLVLLPGPPREMRAMLPEALAALGLEAETQPMVLCTTGLAESDVQLRAQRALAGVAALGLTVLARPGEVRVVLFDEGAGAEALASAGAAVADALGDECFSRTGESLAEAVLRLARDTGATIATAESCTGGMIAAALTDIPGSSDVFLGGVVSYSDQLKMDALAVPAGMLAQYGAVSEEVAGAMAEGVRALAAADLAVSVTGVAGPGGGSPEKPVGLVWFGLSAEGVLHRTSRRFPGDRATVRLRATAVALDLLRRRLAGIGD